MKKRHSRVLTDEDTFESTIETEEPKKAKYTPSFSKELLVALRKKHLFASQEIYDALNKVKAEDHTYKQTLTDFIDTLTAFIKQKKCPNECLKLLKLVLQQIDVKIVLNEKGETKIPREIALMAALNNIKKGDKKYEVIQQIIEVTSTPSPKNN